MQLTQIEYIIVLIVTVALHHALWRYKACRRLLLLVVSLYFFAYWDVRLIPLLIGYVLVGWLTGVLLPKILNEKYRKILLTCSITFFIVLLGIFKYANFFLDSLHPLIECIGWKVGTLKWTLPLGISFFTFQSISYVVDVSRKHELQMGILDYALYICFFPKLTAGPLIRCEEFSKQLDSNSKINSDDLYEGVQLFIFGLFKKIFIADRLADFIDNVFMNHLVYSGGTLWLAALAYSVYLYCDFSGYSDMAIGSSRLLGIKIEDNFNWPYLSRNITEFWRRWHISLSLWLRDYLYIPLGGNRKGIVRSYANQIVTMLLGGLWHGANITFIIWGGECMA